ncbi:hypothetical protein C8J56DRAFT_248925 [Mycena floridula]|nr:hypothetical protein C8J56DRAFT_248925 [Mycena floridula]
MVLSRSDLSSLKSFENVEDIDAAARLLSLLCPPNLRERDYYGVQLGAPESFAAMLHRQYELHEKVKTAHSSYNFDEIWHECDILTYPYPDPEPITTIEKLLDGMQPLLNQFVQGELDVPRWNHASLSDADSDLKDHIDSLNLLSFSPKEPNLQLYRLGSFQSQPILRERLDNLFQAGRNTFLVNVSGSGKTRLLHEGIYINWGFYVTAATDAGGLGSSDVPETLKTFPERRGFEKLLPDPSSLAFHTLRARNREVAAFVFSQVLLARLLVFRTFLQAIRNLEAPLSNVHKRQWLILQLRPLIISGRDQCDIFHEVLSCLARSPLNPAIIAKTNSDISEALHAISDLLGPSAPDFFITLDEANVVTTQCRNGFHDENGTYGIMREILQCWKSHFAAASFPVTFVAAGTEIRKADFIGPEWSSYHWSSNTGAFDNKILHHDYLAPFLPRPLAESASGQLLLQRNWDWLHGRHRWTARSASLLLEKQFQCPHRLLNHLVLGWTGYQAKDGDEFAQTEGKLQTRIPGYGKFNVDALSQSSSDLSRSTLHEIIFHYLVTSIHPPAFGYDRVKLVTTGFGRFWDTEQQAIVVDEPLPLVSVAVWFSKAPRSLVSYSDFVSYVQRSSKSRPYSAVGYLSWYLASTFASSALSTNVFIFPVFPSWIEGAGELVFLEKQANGSVKDTLVTPSHLTPNSPPIAFAAQTPQDVITWLQHERPAPFCICPPECNADIIFVLRKAEKYVWVGLHVSGSGSVAPVSTGDIERDFQRMLPRNLFNNVDASIGATIAEAFEALPNAIPSCGNFNMLRVVACSFLDQQFMSAEVAESLEGSPVAMLSNEQLEQAYTHDMTSAAILDALIPSVLGSRPRRFELPEIIPESTKPLPEVSSRLTRLQTARNSVEPSHVATNTNVSAELPTTTVGSLTKRDLVKEIKAFLVDALCTTLISYPLSN